MSIKASLISGTSAAGFRQVWTIVLGMVLVGIAFRGWGAERYGLWLLLQNLSVEGLGSIAELGIHGALIRELTRAKDSAVYDKLLRSGFWLLSALGVLVGVLFLTFSNQILKWVFHSHGAEVADGFWLLALGFPIGFSGLALKSHFAAQKKFLTLEFWETLRYTATFVVVMNAILFDFSLFETLLWDVSAMAGLTLFFVIWESSLRSLSWDLLSPTDLRPLITLSSYVFSSKLLGVVVNRAPQVMLGTLLGPASVTTYQIATRFPRVFKSIQGILNSTLPTLSASLDVNGQREKLYDLLIRMSRFSMWIQAPVLLFVFINADAVLKFWIGQVSDEVLLLTRGLIIIQGIVNMTSVASSMASSHSHFRRLLPYYTLSSITNLTVMYFAIPVWEVRGIALAIVLSTAVDTYAIHQLIQKEFKFRLRDFWREAFICLAPNLLFISLLIVPLILIKEKGWVYTLLASSALGLCYLLGFYFMKSEDKIAIQTMVKSIQKRLFKPKKLTQAWR